MIWQVIALNGQRKQVVLWIDRALDVVVIIITKVIKRQFAGIDLFQNLVIIILSAQFYM